MKKIRTLAFMLLVLMLSATVLFGCNSNNQPQNNGDQTTTEETTTGSGESTPPPPEEIVVTFSDTNWEVSKKDVIRAEGNVLTIVAPGRYRLSGKLTNAQIRVEVEKTEKVELVLAGVDITNTVSAPLYIKSADKIYIELVEGTVNNFTDAKNYSFPEGTDKPNACIYSSEDIIISGKGTLNVTANYNNGIGTKNDMKIKEGIINVVAAKNALKGNQSVEIKGGTLDLKGMDGIKSDSTVVEEGIVEITGGTVNIVASDDGIQAYHGVHIKGSALVTVDANDNDINCDSVYNVVIAAGALISK